MSERRLWTAEVIISLSQQDSIIKSLVEQHGGKKWTQIAIDMKNKFPNLSRSSKQIRERWYNHLDPQINRNCWSREEEGIILEAHRRMGSKWKQIAKLLTARTDSSVKNHFYSTLRRSLRRINKFLGFKNSTNQMREIKPSILCKLVEDGQKSSSSRALIDGIFNFANFKPTKLQKLSNNPKAQKSFKNTEHEDWDLEQRKLYKSAIEKLKQFNCSYENGQHSKVKKQNCKKNGKQIKSIESLTNDNISMLETKQNLENTVKQEEISKEIGTFSDCDFSCENDWPEYGEIEIKVGFNDESEMEENVNPNFPSTIAENVKMQNENFPYEEIKVQQFFYDKLF